MKLLYITSFMVVINCHGPVLTNDYFYDDQNEDDVIKVIDGEKFGQCLVNYPVP